MRKFSKEQQELIVGIVTLVFISLLFPPLHAKEEAKSKNGKVVRILQRVRAGLWQRMLANMPAAARDFSIHMRLRLRGAFPHV